VTSGFAGDTGIDEAHDLATASPSHNIKKKLRVAKVNALQVSRSARLQLLEADDRPLLPHNAPKRLYDL
jgi:hypothetical protein